MKAFSILLSISIALFFSHGSSADTPDRAQRLGIGSSFSGLRLFGGEKSDSNVGGYVGLQVYYGITDFFIVNYNWNYGSNRPRTSATYVSPHYPDTHYKTFLSSNIIQGMYYFPMKTIIEPFIAVGTGLLVWELSDVSGYSNSLFDNGLFYGRSLSNGQVYNALLLGAVGSDWQLSDKIKLTGMIRLAHIFDQKTDNIGTGDINNKFLQFEIGLSYHFFSHKDSDGDGIIDRQDAAPLAAEDFDNFQDEDGAPDPDNDDDGVPDNEDKEPLIAEDIDGFQDNDGVPDPDNDWDGLEDFADAAPNEPEDFDNYQDDDGVPDPDNDGDGVPDISDACKDEAETWNGYRDDDGCPDSVPKPILQKGERLVLSGVNFELGSAGLTLESYAILDQVFESLYVHPEVEVEIRGHTDNTGGLQYNQMLSEARAETVRIYLIQRGIDSHRLLVKGYGASQPIVSNNTPEDRAQNRRIEFFRLK